MGRIINIQIRIGSLEDKGKNKGWDLSYRYLLII